MSLMKYAAQLLVSLAMATMAGLLFEPAIAATLSVSPASGTFTVGDTFTVDILLNTEGVGIDGVDINKLNYDQSLLEVMDADGGMSGVQILPGTLMPSTNVNSVDAVTGTIIFSQVTSGGSMYTNTSPAVLATVTFRSLSSGAPAVRFDFAPGSTSDTNVAADGSDILTTVVDGSYTLEAASSGGSSGGGSSGGGSSGGGGGGSSGGGGGGGGAPRVILDATPTPVVTQQPTAPFLINLFFGFAHSDVRHLQEVLNRNPATQLAAEGPGSPGFETDFFGSITEDAVRRFQCLNAIVCDGTTGTTGYGVAGPQTRTKLNALYATGTVSPSSGVTAIPVSPAAGPVQSGLFTAPLEFDVVHPEVTLLQNHLASDTSLYPERLVTGYYGELTQAAVQRFQCRYDIACSGSPEANGYGRVGPRTRAKLNEIFAARQPAPPVSIVGSVPPPTVTAPPSVSSEQVSPSSIEGPSRPVVEREDEEPIPSPAESLSSVASPAGVLFDRTLGAGDVGEDVKTLQKMLARDRSIYPEGYVTGYYSRTTEIAVRQFQSRYDIVSSGTPEATGYGAVGPSTQRKLLEIFGRP